MSPGATQWLRIAVLLMLGLAYALTAYWFTADPGLAEYGAILSVAPWLVIGLVLAWQSTRRGLLIAVCLAALLALYLARATLLENFTWVYFIQHAGSFLALAIAFGRTLRLDREPICSRFARTVHGPLPNDVARYTRQITWAWTVFFVVLCLISLGLFMLAPFSVWSLFANLLTPVLVTAMFGVEYLVRVRVLPKFEHIGVLRSVRAVWAASSASATPGDSH